MHQPVVHKRALPGATNQCHATIGSGQCPYEQIEGSQMCHTHTPGVAVAQIKKESIRNYHAAQWRAQLNQYADTSHIKSLRDEIGLLRFILDKKLQSCHTDRDLMMHSGSIGEMILKIERLVTACHKLDLSLGVMLDKTQLDAFAITVIELVGTYLTDPSLLSNFSEELVKAIQNQGTPENRLTALIGPN